MWDEIKKRIVNRADWIFCILLVGFILSWLSDSRGAEELRTLYIVGIAAVALVLVFRWAGRRLKKWRDTLKGFLLFFLNVVWVGILGYTIYRLPAWLKPVREAREAGENYVREILVPLRPVFSAIDTSFDIVTYVIAGVVFLFFAGLGTIWIGEKLRSLKKF